MRSKEDELDYKSSSDNQEPGSGEDPDEVPRGHKRRHHRHTQHQIQEMERLFKKCPHPDEKARLELSRELNLDPRQVKFWFQNKRTQMKAQQERHDNSFLRNDNDKLRSENQALREAIRNVVCHKCGGPANYAEISFDEQQLKMENARLREEVSRLSAALAEKSKGLSSFATVPSPTSSTDLALQTPSTTANEITTTAGPSVAEIASRPLALTDAEKPMVVELAVSAMEELAQVAQAGEPLWVPDPHTGIEIFDVEEYMKMKQFPRVIGPTPPKLKVEATRETEHVVMNAASLVETLMDVDRWADMFASIISKASTVEVLSEGVAGSFDGTMQVMYAELQMATPMVPTREVYFMRYSKRVDELWVVVDVAVDSLRANPPPSLLRCRKRPSGCVVEETASGYSKVTWVEHVEVDDKGVHPSFQTLVNSGMAFGAQRWLATLQRQCERIVSSLANIRDPGFPNVEGRRAMLKLAERMSKSFCKGVSASASHTWITLSSSSSSSSTAGEYANNNNNSSIINGRDHDSSSSPSSSCRVVIRKSVEDAGRPPGIVLCAATSLTLPAVPPSRVFEFLSDERYRTEWDILSNMGVVEEMIHISKGHGPGNVVSLLRVNAVTSNQSNMLILQECSVDKAGWMVVYAPVDVNAMTDVLNGGDPDAVLLLPSGFSVLPHHSPPFARPAAHQHAPRVHHHPPYRRAGPPSLTADANGPPSPSSLLTVAFQILVDHLPTAKLSLDSIATVNTLISSTVSRIRGSLSSSSSDL